MYKKLNKNKMKKTYLIILATMLSTILFSQDVIITLQSVNSGTTPVTPDPISLDHITIENISNGSDLSFTTAGLRTDLSSIDVNLTAGTFGLSVGILDNSFDSGLLNIDVINNRFYLQTNFIESDNLSIKVINLAGQILNQKSYSVSSGSDQIELEIPNNCPVIVRVDSKQASNSFKLLDLGDKYVFSENMKENTLSTKNISDSKSGWSYQPGDVVEIYAFSGPLTGTLGVDLFLSHTIELTPENNDIVYLEFGTLLPEVITESVSDLSCYSVRLHGNVVSSLDLYDETYKGFCYATHIYPTIDDEIIASGSGTGNFDKLVGYLLPSTTYYFRAYATNGAGTAYGENISFTTFGSSVITNNATDIDYNSAYCSGEVSDVCGYAYQYGICWSNQSYPTIENNIGYSNEGDNFGSFNSYISSLETNTTYYVRAYATYYYGTIYGNEICFTTGDTGIPSVITTEITDIAHIRAQTGGNVTSSGGSSVTQRGVCYGTSSNPDLSDEVTSNGSGNGVFISSLSDLTPGQTYYVRAYATNANGTAYGNQVQFTTTTFYSQGGGVTDYDGNNYGSVVIGTQEWLSENLRSTHYSDGTPIPLVTDFLDWGDLENNDTDKAYCFYNNNSSYATGYGALYTYAAATNGVPSTGNQVQGVCPNGWHLPTEDEWDILNYYIFDDLNANGLYYDVQKAIASTSGWNTAVGNGYDYYGFAAYPTGGRSSWGTGTADPGEFEGAGDIASWWTSTNSTATEARVKHMNQYNNHISTTTTYKSYGTSVRCVKN